VKLNSRLTFILFVVGLQWSIMFTCPVEFVRFSAVSMAAFQILLWTYLAIGRVLDLGLGLWWVPVYIAAMVSAWGLCMRFLPQPLEAGVAAVGATLIVQIPFMTLPSGLFKGGKGGSGVVEGAPATKFTV
jgi:hypothetical protein